MQADIATAFRQSTEVFTSMMHDHELQALVEQIARSIVTSLQAGGKVMFFGNGGSAADAQHMAGEFVSRFLRDRQPICGLALSTDSSVLTSIANDYGYEQVFSRQILAFGRRQDVAFAYSTSGNSANVLNALQQARTLGLVTVGLSGESGGKMLACCDFLIRVPSRCVPRIQEAHLLIGHTICQLVELSLADG